LTLFAGLIYKQLSAAHAVTICGCPYLWYCAVEGKRHIGTVMCWHMCAKSVCVSQRVATLNIVAQLSRKVHIFYFCYCTALDATCRMELNNEDSEVSEKYLCCFIQQVLEAQRDGEKKLCKSNTLSRLDGWKCTGC